MASWCALARWRQRPHVATSSLMTGALGTGVQLKLIAWLFFPWLRGRPPFGTQRVLLGR
jgi:hypothetical protein